jgi:hypothetical protein
MAKSPMIVALYRLSQRRLFGAPLRLGAALWHRSRPDLWFSPGTQAHNRRQRQILRDFEAGQRGPRP